MPESAKYTPETLRALTPMTWTPAKMRYHAAVWEAQLAAARRLAEAAEEVTHVHYWPDEGGDELMDRIRAALAAWREADGG